MTKTISQMARDWHLALIGRMMASAVICIWIANVTPIATFAAADETPRQVQLLA